MSEQNSSVFIGPFRDNENDCYLRQLWDRKLYRFLRSWYRSVEMDPTIGPDERGLIRVKKTDSGEGWGIPPGAGGGSSYEYASYFKVVNASTAGTLKIGVVDGGNPTRTDCGAARINGEQIVVSAWESTVATAGVYWVWLHMWIAVDGAHAEILRGGANEENPPNNPNGGVAFSSQLLGRATVLAGAITAINQDYLRGGEHSEYLFGDCDGYEVEA